MMFFDFRHFSMPQNAIGVPDKFSYVHNLQYISILWGTEMSEMLFQCLKMTAAQYGVIHGRDINLAVDVLPRVAPFINMI